MCASHNLQGRLVRWCVTIALAGGGAAAFAEGNDFPVQRVALFSSGVAYFERAAEVNGDRSVELRFRTDQINDIIKSLVVRDLDGGTINAVSYASKDPIEKTLKSFGVDITGKPTLAGLLDQLRGEPVDIAGPRKLSGVILGVEKQKVVSGDQSAEFDVVNLLTADGVHQLRVGELTGIKFTNEKIDAELRKALTALAQSHDADRKSVTIDFRGNGQRRVRAAYLLEAPIWKTTYRLVLGEQGQPFLQGWATIENLTEEDWRDVRLTLVSGRPISFAMDLYTPIYIPRPRETLELFASLTAPDFEAREERPDAAELSNAFIAGVPLRRAAGEGGASRGRMEDQAHAKRAMAFAEADAAGAPASPAPEPTMAESMGESVESVAAAEDAGELFAYDITAPVSIARQQSAMLPIVNAEVQAEKVSIYNPQTHPKHPLNGLYLTNSTNLHLMQGPITLFDGETYAGDAKLPDLKPGEKRLVAYALDLGAEVILRQKSSPRELVSLKIAKGTAVLSHKFVDERTYVVKNKLDRDKTVLLEQPYSDDWKLLEPKEPFERTASLSRFKLVVAGGKTAEQVVKLEHVAQEYVALGDLDFDRIRIFQKSGSVSPKVKEALEQVVKLRTELDQADRQRQQAEQSLQETIAEQARIRDNLKTLKEGSDAYTRQMKKFDELETGIETRTAQVAELRQTVEQKRRELEAYLLGLNVE